MQISTQRGLQQREIEKLHVFGVFMLIKMFDIHLFLCHRSCKRWPLALWLWSRLIEVVGGRWLEYWCIMFVIVL